MCGIFGYCCYGVPCSSSEAADLCVEGLRKLEYRGYDSAGVCIDGPDTDARGQRIPLIIKSVGNIDALKLRVDASRPLLPTTQVPITTAISHTRWATHGSPTEVNAHPHSSDASTSFVIVHNGIINNYKELRRMLEKKHHVFESDTDTEVIAKLTLEIFAELLGVSKDEVESKRDSRPPFATLVSAVSEHLNGAFALLFKSRFYPGECVAIRRGSPLIIGIKSANPENLIEVDTLGHHTPSSPARMHHFAGNATPHDEVEYFFSSDASAIVGHTKEVVYLEDHDVAHLKQGKLKMLNVAAEMKTVRRDLTFLEMELEQLMKGDFEHFMLKEIFEQPESTHNTLRGRVNFGTGEVVLGGLVDKIATIRRARRIIFLACGTSFHAGKSCREVVSKLSGIPVSVELAGEYVDNKPPVFRDDVCVFISQSGETADTLSALDHCLKNGAMCLGITNTVGSTIARATNAGVHINAGAEIGVASTKAFTSQVVAIILFALMLAADSKSLDSTCAAIVRDLSKLKVNLQKVLKMNERILGLAKTMVEHRSLLMIGRGPHFATCLEGALKIKEISYMHAEGIMAGELKHGTLALVDENMPVLVICNKDKNYDKTLNALNQVITRSSCPIILCDEDDEDLKEMSENIIEVPHCESDIVQVIINVVPLQLLSYHLACLRGHNVDCPRNLAKSVTVE